MTNAIRPLSAAALLAIAMPVHAGLPPKTQAPPPKAHEPAAPPAPVNLNDNLMWPPELKEGRRAWSTVELTLLDTHTGKPTAGKLPANAELRLGTNRVKGDKEWFLVEAVASDSEGWAPAEGLTRTWPKGDADTLAAMLGDRSAEIAVFETKLQNDADVKERLRAYQEIYQASGITDEKLFDSLAVRLVRGLNKSGAASGVFWGGMLGGVIGQSIASSANRDTLGDGFDMRRWQQEVAWLTKALAASGYAKYRPLLERAAETDAFLTSGKISAHANAALDDLENFARWNRVINDPTHHKPEHPHEFTRLINMLRSGEPALQRPALTRMAALKQEALFDEVEAEFASKYKQPLEDKQSDTVARMARTLGSSANPKYRATLKDAASNASTSDVKRHAAKAAAELPAI